MSSITVESTVTIQPGIDFDDVVERELRDQATDIEVQLLASNTHQWRQSLLMLKKKTEVQFTACKARRFAAWSEYQFSKLDPNYTDDQLDSIYTRTMQTLRREQDWKHKANFFLSKIEQRLNALNHD
jgi:hypothetical protein